MTYLKYSAVRSALFAVAAAVIAAPLALSAEPAHSESVIGLSGGKAAVGEADGLSAPAGALPSPTRRARPFRMHQTGVCADGTCKYTFISVAENKLLRIENVTCIGLIDENNPNQFVVLSTTSGILGVGLVATLPADQLIPLGGDTVFLANSSGPYFFQGGETVYMLTGGSQGRCTISGYLSRTD